MASVGILWSVVKARVNALPITLFYEYLWRTNKPLLFKGVFVSYIMPILFEALPLWFLSSRKLGNRLRKNRILLNYNMVTGRALNRPLLVRFVMLTLLHSILDTLQRHLRNKVSIENRLTIRRLVMERLLYSEISDFERLRTLDIEYRISADISQTLNFFTFTMPLLVESLYALVREGVTLYSKREHLDVLSFVHPVCILVLRRIIGEVKYHFLEKKQKDQIDRARTKMSRLVSNTLDGLVDIQVNNLQHQRLEMLDKIIERELKHSLGYTTLLARTWSSFAHRNVLEFAAELFVAHSVMNRQDIDHEAYNTLQYEINRVILLARRAVGLGTITRNMLEFQSEVVDLLSIPNFLFEDQMLDSDVHVFEELVVRNILFTYKEELPPALDFYGTLSFLPGMTYAIVGCNRSGKSTLANIICKLYKPQLGEVLLNGRSYEGLSRVALRDIISYISQKPFLFPGTIRENILIGNPNATEREVFDAASAAGIFEHGSLADSEEGSSSSSHPMRRSVSFTDFSTSLREHTRGWSSAPKSLHEDYTERLLDPSMTDKLKKLDILNTKITARAGNLSGGFAQSVALARAFVKTSAKIIILDEAMGQMDPYKKRETIFPRLFKFSKKWNMCLVIITHDLPSIQTVDHIYVMDAGKLLHQGTHKELVSARADVYMKLLGLERKVVV